MTGMAVLQYGNLRINLNERRVYVNEQIVELTMMEFNILYTPAGLLPGGNFTSMQCPMILPPALKALPVGSTRYEKTKYQCDSYCA